MSIQKCQSCRKYSKLYRFENDLVEPHIIMNICSECYRKALMCVGMYASTPKGREALAHRLNEMKTEE